MNNLSENELYILNKLALGQTGKDIAVSMGYSYANIRRLMEKLFIKSGVSSQTALISWGFRNGYIK